MTSPSWQTYTTCLLLAVLCVLCSYHGAWATERCERHTRDSRSLSIKDFNAASPSIIKKLLENYLESRKAKQQQPPQQFSRPDAATCLPQGVSCNPMTSRPCCGRMNCYRYNGQRCEVGDRCVCRNSQYHRDTYF